MSFWLYTGLADLGVTMICMEAFQAAQPLKNQCNNADKNDARGLAQIARLGGNLPRCVTVCNQEVRTLLTMRHYMVSQKLSLQNSVTGVMKQFGLIVRRGSISAATFRQRVLMKLGQTPKRRSGSSTDGSKTTTKSIPIPRSRWLLLGSSSGLIQTRASGAFCESGGSFGFDFMIQHGRRTCHVSRLFFGPSPADC